MALKKKTTKTEKSEQVVPPKLIEAGNYSLVLSREEIVTAVQVLSFAQGMFEQMAVNSHKEGDTKAAEAWSTRALMTVQLYSRLRDVANIGEPTSREVH